MRQNSVRNGMGFGKGKNYAANEKNAELRTEYRENAAMHSKEVNEFYANHPELRQTKWW